MLQRSMKCKTPLKIETLAFLATWAYCAYCACNVHAYEDTTNHIHGLPPRC